MSADKFPTRPLPSAMSQLMEYMEAGAEPMLKVGMPGSTIDLGAWDKRWRSDHNGQPVDPRTINGLMNRGLVERITERHGLRTVYRWQLCK